MIRNLTQLANTATTITLVVCSAVLLIPAAGCKKSPQERYAAFLSTGKSQLNKKDYERAVLEFRNAAALQPKSAEVQYQLGLAYLGLKDSRSAVTAFWRALDADPKYTAAELKLAQLASMSSDPAELREAEKHLRKVLQTSGNDPDALNTLAVTQWRLGNNQQAEQLFSKAIAENPQSLESAANLAKIKLARKDVQGAEAILKSAVDANPNFADAVVTLGHFYVAAGRNQEADQQFRRALQIDPKNGPALVSAAASNWRAGRIDEAGQLYKQASALPDREFKSAYAMFLYRAGKRDQAIAEFEKLAKEDPRDREARTRLIAAYQDSGRPQDAEKVMSSTLEKNPRDVQALLQRSRLYLRDGKISEAEADLRTVLRFEPNSAEAHQVLAEVYKKAGSILRARQELNEAVRLNPESLSARLQLADILITTGAPKTALEILDQAPEGQKNQLLWILQRNWAYLGTGNIAEAKKGLERARPLGDNTDTLIQDGTLKLMQREFAAARLTLLEALRKDPDNYKALNLVLQTYGLQQQGQAGLTWIRQYATEHPSSASVQYFYGQIAMQAGNREDARKAFMAAKAADPSLSEPDFFLAQLEIMDGRLEEAKKRLSEGLERRPNDTSARILLGSVEDQKGNHTAAIEQYRKAVALDDSNIQALNKLAYSLSEVAKQHDEALKYAQKAQELAPKDPQVQDTLGWVLYRKGLYSMAVPYLEESVATQPTAVRKGHLAVAYSKVGEKRKSEDMLQGALKINPAVAQSDFIREVFGVGSDGK